MKHLNKKIKIDIIEIHIEFELFHDFQFDV